MTKHTAKLSLTIKERRENHLRDLTQQVIKDHQVAGYKYPVKTINGVALSLPIGLRYVHQQSTDIWGIGPLIHFDGQCIVIDVWEIYDHEAILGEAMESLQDGSAVTRRGHECLRKIVEQSRHLYRTPKREELRNLLSEALGKYLVSAFLKERPESWLNGESLVGSIVREGLGKSFYCFDGKSMEEVSMCVWGRFYDNDDARLVFWSSTDFRARAGCTLLSSILRDFRQEGVRWFVENSPSIDAGNEVWRLPEYATRAYQELSASIY